MGRTEGFWNKVDSQYLEPEGDGDLDILLKGLSRYFNFNSIVGTSGYGFRDNAGTMQFKDSGGAWASLSDFLTSAEADALFLTPAEGDAAYVNVGGDTMTGDLIGKSFVSTRNGTVTRDGSGYISTVALTGGRTLTVTRNGSNFVTSITDATRTWTFTRNASDYITSWAIT